MHTACKQECTVHIDEDDNVDDDDVVNEETSCCRFLCKFSDASDELCASCAATHKVDLLLLHRVAIKSSA